MSGGEPMAPRLREFLAAIEAAIALPESALVQRAAALMRTLVAHDDWLPSSHAASNPQAYQQHLLHLDPRNRFALVSFVWGPDQCTPIHDHKVWGVVAVLRGAERSQRYRLENGRPVLLGAERLLEAGQIEVLRPVLGDIHRVRNASSESDSISIHLYGGDIGRIERSAYSAADGAARTFVSGYSGDLQR